MNYVKYVSDNPYRLLQVGSGASSRDLRKAAEKAARTVQAGLPQEVGLETTFGAEELPRAADLARNLTNDPQQQTIYRLFWPFAYERPPQADGTTRDLQWLIAHPLSPSAFYVTQLRFLQAWFDYQEAPTEANARASLTGFHALMQDAECGYYLGDLLRQEGADVAVALPAAWEQAAAHLLETICQQAADAWEAGEDARSQALLGVVCASGFSEDTVNAALKVMVSAGDREAARLHTISDSFDGWTPERGTYNLQELSKLRGLADLIAPRVPAARLWRQEIDDCIGDVAGHMRSHAIDIANEKEDWSGSRAILQQIQTLPLSAEWRERLTGDYAQLEKNEKMAGSTLKAGDIRPVDKPPSLATINGVGTKLYGRSMLDQASGIYISTLYFVVLFLPIFPMARYVVRDAEGGGWYFMGKAPLSKFNKIHLGVSLGMIGLFALFIMFSAPSGSSRSSYGSDSGYTYSPSSSTTPDASVMGDGSGDPPPPPANETPEQRKSRLYSEALRIKMRLKTEEETLPTAKTAVTLERTRLEAQEKEVLDERDRLEKARKDGHKPTAKQKTDFEAEVDKLEASWTAFNKSVQAYNKRVDKDKADVKRLTQISDVLKQAGE